MRAVVLAGALIVAATAAAAPAEAALGLGVSTPTVALSLKPGQTASGNGGVVVTPGIGTWQLSVADTTAAQGHLAKTTGCPSYAEPQTTNALTISASGPLSTSTGPKTVTNSAQVLASGTLGDTLTMLLSLSVGASELLPVGCTYTTTLTYTLQ